MEKGSGCIRVPDGHGSMSHAFAGSGQDGDKDAITSVSIRVRSDVQADYELNEATVYAATDSNLYTTGAYKWVTKNKEYWEPGDEPKVQIEIHARSGYYFNRVTGPSKFQIDGATYASVKRTNNDETLLLTVKLTPASGTLEIPESVEWMGVSSGKATWAPGALCGRL